MRFLLLCILFSLGYSSSFGQQLPEKFYSILEGYSIQPDSDYPDSLKRFTLTDGNKRVFHFRKQTKKFDKTIAYDVGFREDFYFQIPMEEDYFILEDEELKEAMAFSKPSCRCIPHTVFYDKGTIKGKKLNVNEWQIEINISGSSPQQPADSHPLQLSGIFKK